MTDSITFIKDEIQGMDKNKFNDSLVLILNERYPDSKRVTICMDKIATPNNTKAYLDTTVKY